MSERYNIGDIVKTEDGSIYVVISSYTYTKLAEGDNEISSLDLDHYTKFHRDSLFFKYSKGVKSLWCKSDYFCVKKLISSDCYELDNNITTFGISRYSVTKIDEISVKEIKNIVKNYYISEGILKPNSRFEYLLPKECNKATHSSNIESNGLESYYFNRLLKIYTHFDDYINYDLEYVNIIGYLKNSNSFLIGDTNSPIYLTDYFTDNSGKKPTNVIKELEKRRKYKNIRYKII